MIVEYIYRTREQGHYTFTFWMHAASVEAIAARFMKLAEEEPDQRKLATTITYWLGYCPQCCVLISDCAEDHALVDKIFSIIKEE